MNSAKTAAPSVLVVGTGFSCRIAIPALRGTGFNIVGLVGANAERTAERAAANGISQSFTDLDEAITRTGAIAVAVATTPHTHGPLALKAIARGCHVLCEKPFAKDTAEARVMVDAAKRAGIVNLVGHEFRWAPERALVARVIAEGQIGEPRFASVTDFMQLVAGPNVDMPDWWFDKSSGGGWLGAAGSHGVDQMRTWLGEIESVSAVLPSISSPKGAAEDSYLIRFRTAKGADGVLQQTAGAWGPMGSIARIAGTKGTVWVDGGAVWIADINGARKVPMPPDLVLPPSPPVSTDPRQQTPKWQALSKIELPLYARLCDAWRTLINGGTPSAGIPVPTFADGLASMEILDAIRKSAANNGALVTISA